MPFDQKWHAISYNWYPQPAEVYFFQFSHGTILAEIMSKYTDIVLKPDNFIMNRKKQQLN